LTSSLHIFFIILICLDRNAPFIHSVWNSPKVLEIVSKLAGIELIPIFEYETGHTNVSIDDSNPVVNVGEKEDETAFAWHYDSVPFVCVTMLSDCTGMVGGETAVRLGEDKVMKVRGPTQVRIPTFFATFIAV
jgi:hypothetical protein